MHITIIELFSFNTLLATVLMEIEVLDTTIYATYMHRIGYDVV